MTVHILRGDVLARLVDLPDESVHCVVTSPPYWGLRDYGLPPTTWGGDTECAHEWGDGPRIHRGGGSGGGAATVGRDQSARDEMKSFVAGAFCQRCDAWAGQLGLEPTPDLFVEHMVAVFREVRRVLRSDGTAWVNLGDSYNAGRNGGHPGGKGALNTGRDIGSIYQPKSGANVVGLKVKDLVGIPWRVAFALQADGWYLRQDIIWHKPNPMPESVRDRCTKAHEYIFLLSKSERYYYDQDAILEPVSVGTVLRLSQPTLDEQAGSNRVPGKTNGPMKAVGRSGKNANSSLQMSEKARAGDQENAERNKRSVWTVTTQSFKEAHFATFPTALIEPCILAGCPPRGTVLDPFGGSGTTGLVADRLERDAILIELNPEYADMAERRIRAQTLPLPFAQVGD